MYFPDLKGFIAGLVIAGIVVGVALAFIIPWLWGVVKPILHAITA